jgi:cystathionine gamma-lyase
MDNDLLALTHYAEEPGRYLNAVTPPVFLTSLHVYEDFEGYTESWKGEGYTYGRHSNPTVHILEKKVAALEHGTAGAAFASGMAAAVSTIMAVCRSGSHVICLRDAYPPVRKFLDQVCVKKLNMTVTYLRGESAAEFEAAIGPGTDLIILESPASFVFSVVDIRAIAAVAARHGVKTYIDNTYCTPLFQKPLDMGVDVVMHTMSKYIGGHSDIIGGILVSKDKELMEQILNQTREWFGGILGPMEAWLAIRGLRTLEARLSRHQETAMQVAAFLEGHKRVRRVNYTGLASHPQRELILRQQSGHSGLLSFELDAPPEAAVDMINRLRLFGKGCSWGGFESLALTPLYHASAEELRALDCEDRRGLIRIHCGLEGAQNLIADLESALEQIPV